ncbi:Autophagy-related protein 16-2 [Myotis brandtii]|uniref:Autophagy-related protein 16-2 n=1 Tax=Myotis brandtii TaxID=109478 RepID=S7MXS1_MYOBR|nr:Autophagy-related protein 16-2 [Myotis brandtii]
MEFGDRSGFVLAEKRVRAVELLALVFALRVRDNHLLEKAELLARFSDKLQPEPNDVTPVPHQGPWEEESWSNSDQVPSPDILRVKWQEEKEGLRLVCGEVGWAGSENVV